MSTTPVKLDIRVEGIPEIENTLNRLAGLPLHAKPYEVRADIRRRRALKGYEPKHLVAS